MLDIGWQEFLLISLVLLIVVGPKELPKVLKSIFRLINKIKSLAYNFQNSINEISNEVEISEIKDEVSKIKKNNSMLDNDELKELKNMSSSASKYKKK